MNIEDYPKTTIILRDVSYEQAKAITNAASSFQEHFSVEVTVSTLDAFNIIKKLKESYGEKVYIGAGTVRTLEDVKKSIEVKADFILGPHTLTAEMINLAKDNDVLAIPSAMTPSEVNEMLLNGADIVKVFPAAVLGPRFFSDIQAPLGKIPLMAVGGVSKENVNDFFREGSSYVGIGSGMFPKEVLESLNHEDLVEVLSQYVAHINQ